MRPTVVLRATLKACVGLIAWLSAATMARAQDVDPMKVAALLMVQGAANGLEMEIANAERVGKDIILRDVEFTGVKDSGGPTKFAEVRLENVRALATGGYMIGRVAMPATAEVTEEGTWSTGAWSVREILVPPMEDKETFAFYAERFEMEPTRFSTKTGKTGVDIGRIVWTSSPFAKGKTLTSKFEPLDITIDPANAPKMDSDPDSDPDTDKAVNDYMRKITSGVMRLRIGGSGTWRDTDGRSTLTTSFDLKDVGKFSLGLDLSGLTAARFNGLQKMIVGLQPSTMNALSAEAAAPLMEAGQALKLHSVAIRFDDASLTRKVLDEAAKTSNQSRAQYVAQLKAMLPLFAPMLGDPKVAAQATAAASAYLDNPKSFEIKLQPSQPASFMELGLMAMTTPQAIVRRLAPQITANK